MEYGLPQLIGLLAAPATLGAIVAWIIEYWDPFHALTPFGKKVAMLIGCYALALLILGTGVWTGLLEMTRVRFVETLIAAAVACYASQIAHLRDHAKR